MPISQRVTDADLRALVSDEVLQPEVVWKLHDLQVNPEFTFQIFCSLSNFLFMVNPEFLMLCWFKELWEVIIFAWCLAIKLPGSWVCDFLLIVQRWDEVFCFNLWLFHCYEQVSIGYISIIYFCDKAKGTIHRSKNKQ